MEKLKLIILFIGLVFHQQVLAQISISQTESKSLAIGNASIAETGFESVFNSPVMISEINKFVIGASYHNSYAISELSNRSIACIIPYKTGAFGFSFSAFGPSDWLNTQTGLTFSRLLSKSIRAAIKLQYFTQKLTEENNTVGQIGYLIAVGYHIRKSNFVLSSENFGIRDIETENNIIDIYWKIDFGGTTQLSQFNKLFYQLNFCEHHKNPQIRVGTEWDFKTKLSLRIGYHTQPNTSTFGFGIHPKSNIINLSFQYKQPVGVCAGISLIHKFDSHDK